ncbi:TIGR02270 family protein [Aquisalimonas sp.]|uniref:TIGR02270 family protein n=1 Tax=Aquisalimonas sp. TaxID=1872621 RepID=UPI0025BC50C2|nr:TIGR02270 family protein [Aquisalimonas sp.]
MSQHAEEAAFLWLLRNAAVAAPHYSLSHLAQLDNRVEAHIDGLRIAGSAGWAICADALLAHEETGEVFCAAVLALESGEADRIRRVYDVVGSVPETRDGLVSAFGWVDRAWWRGEVRDLLHSDAAYWRRIAMAAAATQRVDPGRVLAESLQAQAPELRATALRVAGLLGREDLLPAVLAQLQSHDATVRFAAAWSATVLGDRGAAPGAALAFVGAEQPQRAERALSVALRALPLNDSLPWVNRLASGSAMRRQAVVACGIIGDPASIPWLLEQMCTPEFARVAGESFTMITGVDLAYEDLEGEWPEGFEAGPTESPEDEDVAMDADEDLPWPDPRLIADWWSHHHGRFPPGQRYLLGKPVTPEHLQWVLRYGMQRQRQAAALELKLSHPGEPLFETRAPGFVQQPILGL